MARSLRAIKRARGTFKAIGALMALLSVLAVCVFAGAEMALANTTEATNYVADTSTADAYKDIFGMPGTAGSETISTRYSGRVWADKSVSAGDEVTFSGVDENGGETTYSLEKKYGGDFLVTYSAMATSQEITQLPKIPVDVVFVLDLSGSMNWGQRSQETVAGPDEYARSQSRLQAMVDSLNTTIATLVEDNPDNRIGIAVFNGTASTLLNLTEARNINVPSGNYLQITKFDPYTSTSDKREAEATVHCNINNQDAITAGGTNIQAGMDLGMSMLTGSDSAYTYEGTTYTRIPNVVLMSDGAPTSFSSATDASWHRAEGGWQQSGTLVREDNDELYDVDINSTTQSGSWWDSLANDTIIGRGDTSNPHSADGFMALLTSSYKKNQITANYKQQADRNDAPNADNAYCRVYTIGFSTDQQTSAMQEMVDVVLNPESTVLGAHSNAEQVREVSQAWENYRNNRETIVHGELGNNSGNYAYQVEIPSNDSNNPDSLYYVDRYFAATNSDELNNAFQQITSAITDSAKIPTETTGGTQTPLHDGYITYTDPIGDYMEVKGITGLLFANTTFVVSDYQIDSQENGATVTTYTLNTRPDGSGTDSVESALYSNQSVNNIIIRVSRDNTTGKQELTVQIPAALIPLRINYVTVQSDGTTVSSNPEETYTNNVYPLRLVYEVGVADGVVDEDGSIVEGDGSWNNGLGSFNGVDENYLTNHSDGSNSVYFYSNAYSGASQTNGGEPVTVGDATMTFTPADDNPFYFIQEDTPLYTSGTEGVLGQGGVLGEPVSVDNVQAGTTYYFLIEYYEGASKVQRVIGRDGSTLSGFVRRNADGQLCILEGSPRLGNLLDVVDANKDPNANLTGTALASYYPTFVDDSDNPTTDHQAGHFKVYLGNNGRLSVSLPGPDVLPALRVTKKDADAASKTLDGAGFALYVDTNGSGQFEEGDDQPMVLAGSGAAEVTTGQDGQDGIALFAPDTYKFKIGTTYFLVETKAPNGYQLMDGAVKIVFSENTGSDKDDRPFMATITFPGAKSSETVYSSAATGPEGSADYQVATVDLTVSDKAIPSLPATGSNGRTALAATGVAAVTLGTYALWSRRRAFDQQS